VIAPYPCQTVVEVDRPQGAVPHHLPGTNKFLSEFSSRNGVPYEATRGGAETMYPDYRQKLEREELCRFLECRIARFKMPRHVEFSEEPLPKTGTGKIVKRELREQFWRDKNLRVQG